MSNVMLDSEQSGTSESIPQQNLLVVDESTENIEHVYQLLHELYDIHFATQSETAREMVEELNPDLVILGIDGNLFDSFLLCQQLQTPVVLLADSLSVTDMIQGIDSGAVEVLTRPLNEQEFQTRVAARIAVNKELQSSTESNIVQTNKLAASLPTELQPEQTLVDVSDLQKVLIVDDSISNIQVLNEILADEHEVYFATSGKQAIEMALEEQPDLIVLDVVMPQMDGYTVCEKLKSMQETKDIGIIFVTSLNEVQDETRGLELGAIDYIVKPFSSHIVKARMHNHMELIQHRKMLSSLSMTDGLTGIANRRQFDQVIHRELHRAIRHKESLTLLLIDIDNFKKYNDHYGHVNGDECLKEIALTIDSCRVRMTDFAARYGGEEFAVVLPDTDREGAEFMANKMLMAIRNQAIAHVNNGDFGIVTASFGIYCGVPDHHLSIGAMIKEADEGLYKAKSLGRNQIVFIKDHE